MEKTERRADPDSPNRDRRFVTRISNPTFKDSAKQTYFFVMLIFIILVLTAVSVVFQGFLESAEALTRSIAEAIGLLFFSVVLFGYGKALKNYQTVETPATLAECFERQRNVWMLMGFAAMMAVIGWAVIGR